MRFVDLKPWRLKYLLAYDKDTGVFSWRWRCAAEFPSARAASTWNTRFAGSEAGHSYGEWPEHIDHINGDKGDNRIANLRSVTNAENRKNQATRKDNTSGVQGVVWDKQTGKWAVRINVDGKMLNLGRYADFDAAVARRKQAEIDFGFHPNHGRAA